MIVCDLWHRKLSSKLRGPVAAIVYETAWPPPSASQTVIAMAIVDATHSVVEVSVRRYSRSVWRCCGRVPVLRSTHDWQRCSRVYLTGPLVRNDGLHVELIRKPAQKHEKSSDEEISGENGGNHDDKVWWNAGLVPMETSWVVSSWRQEYHPYWFR